MDHFRQISWCKELLEKPGVVTFTPTSLVEPNSTTPRASQDQLFYRSLRNDGAIPHSLGFYETAPLPQGDGKHFLIPSTSLLFDLQPGVNGYNACVHGGFFGALIDEAMGNLIAVNGLANDKYGSDLPQNVLNMEGAVIFTVGINIRLQKAISTPQVIQVKSELVKIDGKKLSFRTVIIDSSGAQCAQSDGMWIAVPKQKL